MLRTAVVLLLILNAVVLSWTAGLFSRWGWGPVSPAAEVQAQTALRPEAFKLIDVQSNAPSNAANTTAPSSVQ